jgi:hypothetical protein
MRHEQDDRAVLVMFDAAGVSWQPAGQIPRVDLIQNCRTQVHVQLQSSIRIFHQ